MKRFGPIIAIVALAALLLVLNQGINHNAQKDDDDAPPPKTAAKTPEKAPAPSTAANVKVALPPEEAIGDPATAKTHLLVGWTFDEANQPNPQALGDALQVARDIAQKSGGAVSAEIVDLDVPDSDLSPAARAVTQPGVQVTGLHTSAMPGNPGSGQLNARMLQMALPHIIGAP